MSRLKDRMRIRYGRLRQFLFDCFAKRTLKRKTPALAEFPPLVADLGGVGRGNIADFRGFGTVQLVNVNLFDEADLIDDVTSLNSIQDGALYGIYSSHLVEHIWWYEFQDVLRVWLRKLRDGGRLEIRCPDFEEAMLEAFRGGSKLWEDVLLHHAYGGGVAPWHPYYQCDGQYHRNLLWERRLIAYLTEVGFKRVRRIRQYLPGKDMWPYDLRFKDAHGSFFVTDLVVEAFKD